jgi:predicted DCC family thiol-disulfide oxidoreductase YuxK
MPAMIYWCAWVLLAVGYCYSGVWKLLSPSWLDGSALMHLITNPLARSGAFCDFLTQCPSLLKILTWTALAGEILFLPLCLVRRGRMVAWMWMLLMHLGILLVVDFADLTFGMLMVHFFTFDPKWFPRRRTNAIVLFDGDCAMCSRWVRFITQEEQEPLFRFAPLQSSVGHSLLQTHGFGSNYRESIVVIEGSSAGARVFTKSSAVLRILGGLGGFWSIFVLWRVVPGPMRDWFYDQVAKSREQLFPAPETCAIVSLPTVRIVSEQELGNACEQIRRLESERSDSIAIERSKPATRILNTSLLDTSR